jgi:serine protease Do
MSTRNTLQRSAPICALLAVALLCASCKNQDPSKTEAKSLQDSLRLLKDSLLHMQGAISQQGARDLVPLKQMYKELKPAVFLIYSYEDQDTAQGSGFFVDSTGIAISNFHVFREAADAVAILDDSTKLPIVQILDYDEDKDYVIFRVASGGRHLPYVHRAAAVPDIGEDCFAVGNPEGLTQTLSTGIISGIRFGGKVLQTTTAITFGSSGGALFNRSGEVVGVTSGGMGEGNLNFAVNISQIPYERFTEVPKGQQEPLPVINPAQVRRRLTWYFSTYFEQKFSAMTQFYADKLDRFYSKFNITKEEAAASLEADWKRSKILSGNLDPDWSSLHVTRTGRGTYEAKFFGSYDLVREEKSKPTHFMLGLVIEMNQDLSIRSIYENILDGGLQEPG